MGDMVQYAAIGDLELVIKELSTMTGRPVAVVYDPKVGWCVTDEVKKAPSRHGSACPEYSVQTYQDWFSRTIGEAALVTFGVRFMPGTLVGRLFRKPTSQAEDAVKAGQAESKLAKTAEHRPAGMAANNGTSKEQGQQLQSRSSGYPLKAGQGQGNHGRSGPQIPAASRQNAPQVQQHVARHVEQGQRDAVQTGQTTQVRQVTRDGKLQPAFQSEQRPGQTWRGKRR